MSEPTLPSDAGSVFDPSLAQSLTDARLQLHHAAQLATAFGISYLAPRDDDGHTTLHWDAVLGALRSNNAGPHRACIAVRVRDLNALVLSESTVPNAYVVRDTLPLHGQSIANAATWIRTALTAIGFDADRYTQRRHYALPSHPVENGANFDASDAPAFRALETAYRRAAVALSALRERETSTTDVVCWPHHFDIATLVTFGTGRSSSVGLSPGDDSYREPYFYANVYPPPALDALAECPLAGGGRWHTNGWIGAVLPASDWAADAGAQSVRTVDFLNSAVAAARRLTAG